MTGELIRRLGMTIVTIAVLAYLVAASVASVWLQGKTVEDDGFSDFQKTLRLA